MRWLVGLCLALVAVLPGCGGGMSEGAYQIELEDLCVELADDNRRLGREDLPAAEADRRARGLADDFRRRVGFLEPPRKLRDEAAALERTLQRGLNLREPTRLEGAAYLRELNARYDALDATLCKAGIDDATERFDDNAPQPSVTPTGTPDL